MRDGQDFTSTVRRGRKVAQPLLVAHVVPGSGADVDRPTSVGFVVSKAVGPAVTRNRVKRRLRHAMRDRLTAVPSGSRVVVRALPAAAGADFGELSDQLDAALHRAGAR
ncbi:ribonuclease P protein component [Aeromicrobium sp. CTD01-1L150]|uniref:ribonuclease P protein component n=1 Tax=Aeromicrobium sp. CTD01-1L150 TaxID=3341830 RepID=UPI0035C170FF